MDLSNMSISDAISLAEAIANYGIAAVVIAVFLVILFIVMLFIFNSNQKQMQILIKRDQERYSLLENINKEYREFIKTQNSKLSESIAEMQQDESKDYPESHKVDLNNRLKINTFLKNLCKDALDKSKADRVSIFLLHNGQSSFSGFPFIKSSIVAEWVRAGHGVDSNLASSVNMPVNIFDIMMTNLFDNGSYYILDAKESIDDDPIVSKILLDNNINSVYYRAITDNSGNMIGYASFEYTKSITEDKISELQVSTDKLCSQAAPVLITTADVIKSGN